MGDEMYSRFAMEGGDVDCRYEDAFERPWTVAMGGPDFSWAEPGLGSNPLNYTLAFCDIIGELSSAPRWSFLRQQSTVELKTRSCGPVLVHVVSRFTVQRPHTRLLRRHR